MDNFIDLFFPYPIDTRGVCTGRGKENFHEINSLIGSMAPVDQQLFYSASFPLIFPLGKNSEPGTKICKVVALKH